ncbi:MAG TPA: DeoR/GlpR family DNA-binding transcription regulator [Candidatus Limnocylindrales bacterium]|nr:DeoR/GlpR family DNA-binding transcription regulator [Candidatus Limnocylindrales bacterium]
MRPLTEPVPAGDGVFVSERRGGIVALVEGAGRARVVDLADRFGVSTVTIRKDLLALEAEGRVVRAHGGAIAPRGGRAEPAFTVRERLRRDEKLQIGRVALGFVRDGESIALDASTTALALARLIAARRWESLTVVTNGMRAALELADVPGVNVIMLGGRVRSGALSVVGTHGDALLRRVNIGGAFLGAMGIALDAGLTDGTEEEAQIKRAMVAAARDVYALVDHTKLGRVAPASFARPDRLARVITDAAASTEAVEVLRSRGIPVTVAEEVGA